MQKIWLKSYPAGVPEDIDGSAYPSLAALFEESFERYAERSAFECVGKRLSYRDLDQQSRHFAAWLQSCGILRGTRIAIMLPNLLQYPIAMAGILRAACIVVNVNPRYTARELEHQLRDSGAEVIVVLENCVPTLQSVLKRTSIKHVLVAVDDEIPDSRDRGLNPKPGATREIAPPCTISGHLTFGAMLAVSANLLFEPPPIGPDDIAFLQYTGGTTGIPKGAILLHRNVIASLLQYDAWFKPLQKKIPDSEILISVVALPLYHIYALSACALRSVHLGGMAILIPNPRDIPGLVETLRAHAFHFFPAVTTLHNALLDNPEFATLDFSKFLIAGAGGMPTQETVAKRWFEVTGRPILEGYGLSETAPTAISNPVTNTAYSGSIGVPMPSTRVSIRDENNEQVPLGQAGEICIKGPQVMAGYWQRPDETAQVMTSDGYFRSGDMGVMDCNGYIKIVGRKKDLILVSGFNVYPNEIEDVVANLPGVFEVAAVGVPDPRCGEAVKLFIVRRDPALTEVDVLRYCKAQLTGYKRPKYIEFRTELPKTHVGKILRRELREPKLK